MKRERLTDTETFHLEIPADENNLGEVRDFISDICSRAGFPNRDTSNTKLAVDEACTNIIKHAYHSQGGEIRIDVQAEPGKVEINIFDRGEAFDWSTLSCKGFVPLSRTKTRPRVRKRSSGESRRSNSRLDT